MDEFMNTTISCFDQPDPEKDYKYEEIFGGFTKQFVFPKGKVKMRDQGGRPSCTSCLQELNNFQNYVEYDQNGMLDKFQWKNPDDFWDRYIAKRGRPNEGASLQDRLKQARTEGFIEGNSVCDKTLEAVANATGSGHLIYTGAANVNWTLTGKTGELTFITTTHFINGHSFWIAYVEGDYAWAPNSFGEDWGKKGYFRIHKSQLAKLYSLNAIVDKDDSGLFAKYKDSVKAKQALDLNGYFWNKNTDNPGFQKNLHDTNEQYRKIYNLK